MLIPPSTASGASLPENMPSSLRHISVQSSPGQMALTLILWGPSEAASDCVRLMAPALDAS